MNVKERELLICRHTQDEGFGAVYERLMLGRFLDKFKDTYPVSSVLEFGCPITKGYDNLSFAGHCEFTVADQDIKRIKKLWKFGHKPKFSSTDSITDTYDLVWNFALLQNNESLLEKMAAKSKKYVLVFTPNILNYGTPVHLFFHLITNTKCQHPESGSIRLRTPWGLKKQFIERGLRVVGTGMIDIPPWPDPAFSLAELTKLLSKGNKTRELVIKPSKEIHEKLESKMMLEGSAWAKPLWPIFAHHLYVLGEVK